MATTDGVALVSNSPGADMAPDRPGFSRAAEIVVELYERVYSYYFNAEYLHISDARHLANRLEELMRHLHISDIVVPDIEYYKVDRMGDPMVHISEFRDVLLKITKKIWQLEAVYRMAWAHIVGYLMGPYIKRDHEFLSAVYEVYQNNIWRYLDNELGVDNI